MSNRQAFSRAQTFPLLAAAAFLAGCTPTIGLLQPDWRPAPQPVRNGDPEPPPPGVAGKTANPFEGPAVQVLVNHITCQLIEDYRNAERPGVPSRDSVWSNLKTDNFVASIDLTLDVTNNESFSPSFSTIMPLTSTGGQISPYITPPAGSATPATSSMFNRTISISGQLTGSQSNSVSVIYQLDMARIAFVAENNEDDLTLLTKNDDQSMAEDTLALKNVTFPTTNIIANTIARHREAREGHRKQVLSILGQVAPVYEWCAPRNGDGVIQKLKGDLLEGDLGIAQTIEDGLNSLTATGYYNVYGSSGPADPNQILPLAAAAKPQVWGPAVAPFAAPAAKGGAAPPSGASAQTSFSALVNFNVVVGAGGGPNWTLLLFKGPSGGGGGGGGGGGASGGGAGGASGGGGSGGGGQLVNYSRNANDTLSITFAPTCQTDPQPPTVAFDHFTGWPGAPPKPGPSWTLSGTVQRSDDGSTYSGSAHSVPAAGGGAAQADAPRAWSFAGHLSGNLSVHNVPTGFAGGFAGQTQTFAEHAINSAQGYIYLLDANGQRQYAQVNWSVIMLDQTHYQLLGSVLSMGNSTPLGTITLQPGPDGALEGSISRSVIIQLTHAPVWSYWETVPSCDVATGPYIQSVLGGAATTSQYLMLQSKLQGVGQ